ncbi:KilA-N domain-containing protein [Methylomonas sp. MED-D]|uniref:KilA-N domain-containing protein n=1 Tax=unclassified Methylomonas TaxID=2608980 RepID=UPI003CFF88A3
MNTLSIVISDTPIRQDSAGRYCLNDLHKAAGGENKHRPSLWLKNQQAQELIDEISKAGIPALEQNQSLKVINGGNQQGVYVAKELVYAYAMWISPKFHLQVIRAYDALVAAPIQSKPFHLDKPISLSQFAEYHEAINAAKADLKSATVFITGEECASLGLHNVLAGAKRRQEEQFRVMDVIIQMELEGKPRHEIVQATGKTFNNVRQVIWQARRDGLLPKEGQA